MTVLTSLPVPTSLRGGFLAIGNFDGVHRGHQQMLARLNELARASDAPAIVMTFDPPPSQLLRPQATPPQLTTIEDRRLYCESLGVDAVLPYPTDWSLLKLSAAEFFQQIVLEQFAARGLVEGPNFFFGRNREGNITVLRQMCVEAGRTLEIVEPVMVDGQLVSSSVIRSLLAAGDLDSAVGLLGHSYRLRGRVVTGAQRGRLLGFPTANLDQIPTLVPAHGVYGGRATIAGQPYRAAIHIGPNPTFAEAAAKVEVHILGFTGDLYGEELVVDLDHRVRAVEKFVGVEALREQLMRDLEFVRQRIALAEA